MEILRTILTVIYVIDCIALTVVVLMQEGKQQGLGAIAGISDTYWGRNKSRSAEGTLIRATKIMAVGRTRWMKIKRKIRRKKDLLYRE